MTDTLIVLLCIAGIALIVIPVNVWEARHRAGLAPQRQKEEDEAMAAELQVW